MPLYERHTSYEEMKRLASDGHVCSECGGRLIVAWGGENYILRCGNDINHKGTRKDYELPASQDPNMLRYTNAGNKRRKELAKKIGEDRIKALAKYEGVVSLTRSMAEEILESIWPEAPAGEKARAALLCASQQLNPLMKHVYLVPFNKGKENESWATVLGINAKRLMASRRGTFSYVDDTPRIMSEEEQIKRFGKANLDALVVIVKLMDPATGATAPGYGEWPLKKKAWVNGKQAEKDNEPYGSDKGNNMFNMAAIHAESQALNRLRPGDMPQGIMIMDEAIAESASQEGIDEDNIVEGEGKIVEEEAPGPSEQASTSNTEETKATKSGPIEQPEAPQEAPQSKSGQVLTLGSVLQWVTSHGKTFTPAWFYKNCGFTPDKLKDNPENLEKAMSEICTLTGWDGI